MTYVERRKPMATARKRVAFLFNHYDNHQIMHAAPFAYALSRRADAFDVHIICSSQSQLDFAREIGDAYPDHKCQFALLKIPALVSMIDPLMSKWVFIRKQAALKANRELFASFYAIVSPERTISKLHDSYGLTDVKFVRIIHGGGDRDGGVDAKSDAFGLTLLVGQKYLDRLSKTKDAASTQYEISGCAKFEAVEKLTPTASKIFDNDNPTIVYAPHFEQSVSSWKTMGVDILDFFYESKRYNLIFAPHVILFKRSGRHNARLPKRFLTSDTMLIDTGSRRSVDMTYMRAASIYLGDASSQVYEFISNPRPCIFADAHQTNWESSEHHKHWQFGPVVRDIPSLEEALSQAHNTFPSYQPIQQHMFDYTFSATETPVSERGADLIANFISRESSVPKT